MDRSLNYRTYPPSNSVYWKGCNSGFYKILLRFCRVETEIFHDMYGIEEEEVNDFAIDCCRQQIEEVYGDRSLEIIRFNRSVGL